MLKVGFISTWHVHTNDYARCVKESGKAVIHSVWDEDAKRGQKWADENNAVFIADFDAFIHQKELDAVVCDAPTTMHSELLHQAIAAGKHVFTEKLLTPDTASCEKLCKAIEKSGLTFTISLPLIPNPKIRYIKQLIDEGALGRVTGARMRRSHSGVSDGWLPDYWFDVNMSAGGAMMDLGAHPVYLLAYLLGAPKRVSGLMTNPFGTAADENAIALAEFENGVLGTCETAFITYGVPDLLEIYGTEGSVFMHGDQITVAQKGFAAIGVQEVSPSRLPAALPPPIVQFLDACINGTGTPENLGTQAALTMTRIIEAAYQSDKDGKTMML